MFEIEKDHIYNQNLNDLSFWYGILTNLEIPTPETYIIKNNVQLINLFDGINPDDIIGLEKLISDIDYYAKIVGYPCFIRTGQTSDKHDWKDSCFLENSNDIIKHLYTLTKTSFMADVRMPRSTETIVVRKIINTKPYFYAFNDMPITKEIRGFIENTDNENKNISIRPYWPLEAFIDQYCYIIVDGNKKEINMDEVKILLSEMYDLPIEEKEFFKNILYFLSIYLKDEWSVDFLQDSNGQWKCIDMALAKLSYKNTQIISLK